jgi:hypothetical protein
VHGSSFCYVQSAAAQFRSAGWLPTPPPVPNRTSNFRFIRLLSVRAVVISTTITEPSDNCGLASALSEPNVRRTLRLHYVRDVCHKTLAHRVPWPSRIPGPRQHILQLSRRRWLLGPSLPFGLVVGCLLHLWRASNGLLCSAYPFRATLGRCFMPGLRASERLSAMCPIDLETFPFWGSLSHRTCDGRRCPGLAGCAHSTCGLCRCDDTSMHL